MKEKTQYTGTKVWFASIDCQENLVFYTNHIPLWMGGVIKHNLNCKQWFTSHSEIINEQTYTFTYDLEEVTLKTKVMISKVIGNNYVDLDNLDAQLEIYLKTLMTRDYKIV